MKYIFGTSLLAAVWILAAVETETISSGWYWLALGIVLIWGVLFWAADRIKR